MIQSRKGLLKYLVAFIVSLATSGERYDAPWLTLRTASRKSSPARQGRSPKRRGERPQVFYCALVVKIPRIQVLLAIERPMVRILEHPHFECAFTRVELCHRVVNFQKHVLGHVLGLATVADDLERNRENKPMVALEQDRKSVVDAALQLHH